MSSIPSHKTNVEFYFYGCEVDELLRISFTEYWVSCLYDLLSMDCYTKLRDWSTLFYKKCSLRIIIWPAVRNYSVLTHISYHCQMKSKNTRCSFVALILNGYIARALLSGWTGPDDPEMVKILFGQQFRTWTTTRIFLWKYLWKLKQNW